MPALDSVVTVDPEVMSGTPVFAGTRVPVKNLLDYLAAGDPLERFLDHFVGSRQIASATLHPLALLNVASGSAMISTIRVPKP